MSTSCELRSAECYRTPSTFGLSHTAWCRDIRQQALKTVNTFVQIMVWRRPGDKPLSEPMMVSLLTHICVTRPQWVNTCGVTVYRWLSVRLQYLPWAKIADSHENRCTFPSTLQTYNTPAGDCPSYIRETTTSATILVSSCSVRLVLVWPEHLGSHRLPLQ